tara:strand:- start:47070 stop:47225 length:156 start_codon:yes stop_codon:yes gene_type:complete
MLENAMLLSLADLFPTKVITQLQMMDSHRPALAYQPESHAVQFAGQERQHG